ncbi:hypothetical protein DL546_006549 [Coniochaeta pulveracea]|uniref:Vacuolar ATPase assembly protein VMA22 n=1 Tax=Coniochaeta pulveracea TaxID=177199 RepID=A0A420Y8S4_9PEZI|nr:hypothetical protein DL546_006549 [Coniochaeta pulveracea]
MAASDKPVTDVGALTEHIDSLLERYLSLLDEYTKLRASLSELQSRVYQNIARANFSAERGVRYGQDLYDQRMQSLKRLVITVDDNNTPSYKIVPVTVIVQEETPVQTLEPTEKPSDGTTAEGIDASNEKEEKKKTTRSRDPLKWFGILTPMPLRQAQSQAVEAVEQIIPRLASVDAEMVDVEIQVRRARKKRAKAEAAVEKAQEAQGLEKAGTHEAAAALPSPSPPPSEVEV